MNRTIALTACSLGNLAAITATAENEQLTPLTVVGGKDRVSELVGSAAYLGVEDMRQQNYTNVNRLLAKVPGVYTREEDGYGLFPNLSIRGNLGTRSEKTTVMEDGILMAPATPSISVVKRLVLAPCVSTSAVKRPVLVSTKFARWFKSRPARK